MLFPSSWINWTCLHIFGFAHAVILLRSNLYLWRLGRSRRSRIIYGFWLVNLYRVAGHNGPSTTDEQKAYGGYYYLTACS